MNETASSSSKLFFAGMAGSRMPIVVSHGEGRAEFDVPEQQAQVLVAMRYLDNAGHPTEVYPYNPNGSPAGITGVTTADGRFTIMMPHPERVFRCACSAMRGSGWGSCGRNHTGAAESPVFAKEQRKSRCDP